MDVIREEIIGLYKLILGQGLVTKQYVIALEQKVKERGRWKWIQKKVKTEWSAIDAEEYYKELKNTLLKQV